MRYNTPLDKVAKVWYDKSRCSKQVFYGGLMITHGSSGYRAGCRCGPCKAAQRNYNRAANPRRDPVQKANYSKLRHVEKTYGLSPAQFETMLMAQCGACLICGNSDTPLAVDHDHVTGEVRGLLCRSCNITLGFVNDNTKVLAMMVEYLHG